MSEREREREREWEERRSERVSLVLFHSAVRLFRSEGKGAVFAVEMQHNGDRRSAEIVSHEDGLCGMVIAVAAMLRGATLTDAMVAAGPVEEDSRLHLVALLLRFGQIRLRLLSCGRKSNDVRAEVAGVGG